MAVPADLHPVVLEYLPELAAGELAPLVGVEHLGRSLLQGVAQRLGAKAGLQSVGQLLGHQVPAMPVHDGDRVEESPGHGQVGAGGRPYLVGPGDRQIAKQLGIDSPFRHRLAGARLPVDGPQPHQSHEPLHPLSTYRHTLPVQRDLHPPGTVAGGFQLLVVQFPHQGQVLLRRSPWGGSRGWSGSLPAAGTAALSTGNDVAGLPVHAAGLGSWTGPFLQEIPLHLELADLLVQASHQGVLALRA